jgi:hypothetical protein
MEFRRFLEKSLPFLGESAWLSRALSPRWDILSQKFPQPDLVHAAIEKRYLSS